MKMLVETDDVAMAETVYSRVNIKGEEYDRSSTVTTIVKQDDGNWCQKIITNPQTFKGDVGR